MKKLLSMLFVVCLMLSLVSAVLAEDYDYPTKDFFDDRIGVTFALGQDG